MGACHWSTPFPELPRVVIWNKLSNCALVRFCFPSRRKYVPTDQSSIDSSTPQATNEKRQFVALRLVGIDDITGRAVLTPLLALSVSIIFLFWPFAAIRSPWSSILPLQQLTLGRQGVFVQCHRTVLPVFLS